MSTTRQPKDQNDRKRVVRLPDGVVLIEPVGRPTHFTVQQIRKTIRELRRDGRSGRPALTAAE